MIIIIMNNVRFLNKVRVKTKLTLLYLVQFAGICSWKCYSPFLQCNIHLPLECLPWHLNQRAGRMRIKWLILWSVNAKQYTLYFNISRIKINQRPMGHNVHLNVQLWRLYSAKYCKCCVQNNLVFRLPWPPIKISDLDKIHMVGRGLLQTHFNKTFVKISAVTQK